MTHQVMPGASPNTKDLSVAKDELRIFHRETLDSIDEARLKSEFEQANNARFDFEVVDIDVEYYLRDTDATVRIVVKKGEELS